tara:strand:+ start:1326 stop:1502 length:177 start_codon:yes stop_codon:yes gene_type:complete
MTKKTEDKKNNLERLYERMLKKYDEDEPMMKSLKRQIRVSKLPEQSLESTYITGKVKR